MRTDQGNHTIGEKLISVQTGKIKNMEIFHLSFDEIPPDPYYFIDRDYVRRIPVLRILSRAQNALDIKCEP